MKTMTIDDLYAKFQALGKDELILDIRTPEEYATGHVPGSRNISHEQVGAFSEELRKYKNVYLYCRSGGRVQMAMMDLGSRGLTNVSGVVGGGMPNWLAANYPSEK